ncbi:MAG: hypothetical protein RLZZ63_1513 [Gemmatimonadota bacterium]
MDTLALRLAAAGGRIDDLPASQLVAAGFTLLQRSAPLVRMLAGRRSALLLPPGPAAVVALAASDGRGAVVLPLGVSPQELTARCAPGDVGAVFTLASHRNQVPASLGAVLLDAIPRSAMVCTPEGREQTVDLGSHVGLSVEGETDIPGRDEECLLLASTPPVVLTHREVLDLDGLEHTVAHVIAQAPTAAPPVASLLSELLIPLLAGRTLRVAS